MVNEGTRGFLYVAFGEGYVADAVRSAASLRAVEDEVSVHLVTDIAKGGDAGRALFSSIEVVERPKDVFLGKIQAMAASPFEKTVFLDADTLVVDSVFEIFELLDRYEFAAAPAPARAGFADELGEGFVGERTPNAFWMVNTGVVGYRRCDVSKRVFSIWEDAYTAGRARWSDGEKNAAYRHDQPSFRWASWRGGARVYVLGSEYNVRGRHPVMLRDRIRVVHEKGVDLERLAEVYGASAGPRAFGSEVMDGLLVRGDRVERVLEDGRVVVVCAVKGTGKRVRMVTPRSDGHLVRGVLERGEYDLGRFENYPVKDVVDIGGHVGAAAVWFGIRYPGCRVVGFEPSRDSAVIYEENVKQVGDSDGLNRVFHAGIAGQSRRAKLHLGDRLTMASSVIEHENSGKLIERVELIDAARAMEESGFDKIDVLKIDTEGCEVEILERLLETGWLARTKFVLLEYHHERDRRTIDQLLAGSGFLMFGANATQPHRGTLKFVHAQLAQEFENGAHTGKPIG